MQGEAIANIGVKIAELGDQQLQAQRTIDRAEGIDALNNASKRAIEIADETGAADGSDYGKIVQTNLEPEIAQVTNKYSKGDPRLTREFASYSARLQDDVNTTVQIRSFQRLEKNNITRVGEYSNTSASRIFENPIEAQMNAEIKNFNAFTSQLIHEKGLSPEKAQAVRSQYLKQTAEQFILGLADRENYGMAISYLTANQAKPAGDGLAGGYTVQYTPFEANKLGLIDDREAKALDAKGEKYSVPVMTAGDGVKMSPQMAAALNEIDPTQKARWIDLFKKLAEGKTKVDIETINAGLSGIEEKAEKRTLQRSDVDAFAADVRALPKNKVTDAAVSRWLGRAENALAVQNTSMILGVTPRDQWDKEREKTVAQMKAAQAATGTPDNKTNTLALEGAQARALDSFERAVKNTKKLQDADPAGFVMANRKRLTMLQKGTLDGDPGANGRYAQQMLATQRMLGMKEAILPVDKAKGIAKMIQGMPSDAETADYLNKLQYEHGAYFPRVMKEIASASKDKTMEKYALVANSSTEDRALLVGGIKREKINNEFFSGLDSADPVNTTRKTAQIKVSNMLAPYRVAMYSASPDGSPTSRLNSYDQVAKNTVDELLARNPSMGADEVAQRAHEAVMSQFTEVNHGKSAVLIPQDRVTKLPVVPRQTMQYFFSEYSTPNMLKSMNIDITKNSIKLNTILSITPSFANDFSSVKGSTQNSEENFYNELSRQGKWVGNSTDDGVMFVIPQSDPLKKKRNEWMPVTTKEEKNLEFKFKDIKDISDEKLKDSWSGKYQRFFN
jgi:hypothetical protein